MAHPKFLAYLVVFCFERWCSKSNSVARSNSKIFSPSRRF